MAMSTDFVRRGISCVNSYSERVPIQTVVESLGIWAVVDDVVVVDEVCSFYEATPYGMRWNGYELKRILISHAERNVRRVRTQQSFGVYWYVMFAAAVNSTVRRIAEHLYLYTRTIRIEETRTG